VKAAKGRKPRRHCTTKTISGSVSFTTAAKASATLARGSQVVARGSASARAGLALRSGRRLAPGRYTLTLRWREGRRTVTTRAPLTLR
jgi:hypothetical protein